MNIKTRIKILNTIFNHFRMIVQWTPSHLDKSSDYMLKAESLIEFLEIEDCNSTGGYDPKSPKKIVTKFDLFDRYLALVNKYKNEKDIEFSHGFNLEKMKNYFILLTKLKK